MSVSEYLISELREMAERPTLAEYADMLHQREPVSVSLDTARILREERDAR